MKKRLDYLDNLRTALTILLVCFHTSIAYGGAGSWILEDVDKSELNATIILFTIFTAVCQAFFMGLFFFISAYFVPGSYDRKGAGKFLTDRLVRLGIPLAAYYFIVGPITRWYAHSRDQQTLAAFYKQEVWSFESTFFGPAWFLEASIYFAVLYVIYRLVMRRKSIERERPLAFPTGTNLLVTAVVLGIIAFAVRLVYPTGTGPLELQLGYFPSYILLFIAGIWSYRNGWLDQIPQKTKTVWKRIWIVAIPILPIVFIATGALEGHMDFAGGANIQAFLYAMWEPFVCIGIIISLIVWFQKRFHSSSPFQKWLSAHAFTVYLIHPPAVVGWTIAFHGVGLPPFVKWMIVSSLAVVTCFVAAGLIRSLPGVKRVL